MNGISQLTQFESRAFEPALADKPVYGDQTFGHGIDGEEKTFESDRAEQGWTLGRYEAWRRNFVAIESQSRLCHRPYVPLSARDHNALRPGGFQFKPFRQRSRHHAKRSASVHKKIDFFNAPSRAAQATFHVEQSHITCLLNDEFILAQLKNNATTLIRLTRLAKSVKLAVDPATPFRSVSNLTTGNQIGLTIPPNVLARADKVIR
jgi:hypothetical protein